MQILIRLVVLFYCLDSAPASANTDLELDSSNFYGPYLIEGIYTHFGARKKCDLHIENSGNSIYITYISNQTSGDYCRTSNTEKYDCEETGRCTLNTSGENNEEQFIDLVNERTFRGKNQKKYKFLSAGPVKQATRFELSGSKGKGGSVIVRGRSRRCTTSLGGQRRPCYSPEYARENYCPEIVRFVRKEVLELCESETEAHCQVIDSDTGEVSNTVSPGVFNENGGNPYTRYYVSLYCRSSATAEVVD